MTVPARRGSAHRRPVSVGRSLWSFSLAICLAGGALAAAPPRARLVGVRVRGDADAAVIEVTADRPVSFTTLRLASPPRLVLDFAEADLSGVPREQKIEDGTIRRVGAALAGEQTARVIVELAGEAEFDVHAEGARLEVRVPRLHPLLAAADAGPAASAARAEARADGGAAALEQQKLASLPTVSLAGQAPAADAEPAAADAAPSSLDAPSAAAAVSAAPPASAAPRSAAEATLAGDPPRKAAGRRRPSINGIGFRPQGAGEVIVRSDRALEYGVEREDHAVLLHLAEAGIPLANNRRPLETAFFGGPVQRIVPLPRPGGTDVRIELREQAAFDLQQSGGVLTVTFNR